MNKGTLAVIAALVISGLTAFGVIDPGTAEKLLGGSAPQAGSSELHAPKSSSPATTSEATESSWHGWSDTNPQINLSHIFQGEINRQGKPTGFHSRPNGEDPKFARVDRVKSGPNSAGIYTAQVSVFDQKEQRWKDKFSTFFPDRMEQPEVVSSILHAWENRAAGQSRPWRGPSGKGFTIEGYQSSRGGINTAYPVYQRN